MALTSRKTSPNVAMLKAAIKDEWNRVYDALDSGCNVNVEYMGNTLGTIAMAQPYGYKPDNIQGHTGDRRCAHIVK